MEGDEGLGLRRLMEKERERMRVVLERLEEKGRGLRRRVTAKGNGPVYRKSVGGKAISGPMPVRPMRPPRSLREQSLVSLGEILRGEDCG